jgi:hypothetical protein
MDRGFLKNAISQASWQTTRLGTAGKVGCGLMVFSLVFFFAAVLPQRAASEMLLGKARVMKAQLRSAPETITGRKAQANPGLRDFYAFFPTIDSSPFWIKELVQIATQYGIEISGSDYRMVQEKEWALARYEMAMPIRAGYPQVRAFIADTLRTIPAMALVDVVIKRQGVESELLEASLKFNLYLNAGKP